MSHSETAIIVVIGLLWIAAMIYLLRNTYRSIIRINYLRGRINGWESSQPVIDLQNDLIESQERRIIHLEQEIEAISKYR